MTQAARRGWRERGEPGLYRAHRLACPSSADQRSGRRCGCPYEIKAPGPRPGATRTVTIRGSITEARAERRRLMAAGRPPSDTPMLDAGTLDEFTGHYLRAKASRLASASVRATEQAYRLRVSPQLGHLTLQELTRERLEVWLGELLGAVSRDAAHKAVKALRVILAAAVEWGRISTNPASRLRLPRPAPEEGRAVERVLDEDQLRKLLTAAAGGRRGLRVETMIRAAAKAGLRRGEVVGLRWPDIRPGCEATLELTRPR
jgi:integrase-like protein